MTVVDLCFPLLGKSVPVDHGYPLYAAISSSVPTLHGASWLGVHPISGQVVADQLMLRRHAQLRLRLPAEHIPTVLPLAGRRLVVADSKLALGTPSVQAVEASPSLDARLVLLKLTNPQKRSSSELGRDVLDNEALADRYRAELARQLQGLDISGVLTLCGRRSMTIHEKRVVGFSVRVSGLESKESIRLQERGLGGRRTLGCGIFRPTRGASE